MSYQFHGQRSSEEVVLIAHYHPLVLLHRVLLAMLVIVFPIFLSGVISRGGFFALVMVACLIVGGLLLWEEYFRWSRTVFLLTTERIVFLEQEGLFHRELVECDLDSIQQVSHKVKGVLHTLAGFGAIHIQTGGSQQPIVIHHMPDPYEIQQEILRVKAGHGFVQETE
ncbi:MAG: PH domain-containing protein [Methanothrix sp.]